MAIALVQTSTEITVSVDTGGSVTVSGVTAGNLLVLVVASTAADDPILSVTDDNGNTWSSAVVNSISGAVARIFYVLSANAGSTIVTVTADVTTDFVAKVQEWSGGTWTLGNTSSIDEAATTSHVCSATAGEIDTTGEAIIIANSVCEQSSGTFGALTVGSGYTQISASTDAVMWQYQSFTVAESDNRGAFTSANSRSTAAVIAAFLCSTNCDPCWWPGCTDCVPGLCTVRKFNSSGVVQWTYLAPKATAAEFEGTHDIAIDRTNNFVYIFSGPAGASNAELEKLPLTGPPITWAVTSSDGTSGDRGPGPQLCVSPSDNAVYFSNDAVNLSGTAIFTNGAAVNQLKRCASGILWTAPYGAFFSAAKANITTGALIVETVQGGSSEETWTSVLGEFAIDSSNNVWFADSSDGFRFNKWDGTTGAYSSGFPYATAIGAIRGFHIDASDNFYVSGGDESSPGVDVTGYLCKHNSASIQQWEVSFSTTRVGEAQRMPIAVDSSGNAFVVNQTEVRAYNSSGTFLWSYDHGSLIDSIDVDSSGNVYISGTQATV